MRYDDRLATVLRLNTGGRNLARVQLRQLLDLLGAAPSEARSDLLDAGYLRLSELIALFPAAEIAALLTEPGLRLRSPRLLASLALGEPPVARAALHAAQLDEASWTDLIPALPPACWSLLWQRRDLGAAPRALLDRLGGGRISLPTAPQASAETINPHTPAPATMELEQLSEAATTPAPMFTTAPEAAAPSEKPLETAEDIGAIVRRIEAFRRAREAGSRPAAPPPLPSSSFVSPPLPAPPANDTPRLPLGEEPAPLTTLDFETDSEGRIIRADPLVAPMLVGLSLVETAEAEGGGPDTAGIDQLIRQHQPIRGHSIQLEGAPAIAGPWHLDATPRFDLLGGRFVGYLGRFRRLPPTLVSAAAAPIAPADSHTDRLRQSLHELRTPVNAIQGFAEIIQQQLFGHTPHEYRALAAVIAADAARMLAGFEELERFARIDSGVIEIEQGTSDLADCVCATLVRLEHHTAARGIALELERLTRPLPLPLASIETERLCWRLLATLAATAAPGERLGLALRHGNGPSGGEASLVMTLPAALAALPDEALFHASVPTGEAAPSAGMFGTGFTLRLAAAEARAAGASLKREGALLRLTLPSPTTQYQIWPGLTDAPAGHSHVHQGNAS